MKKIRLQKHKFINNYNLKKLKQPNKLFFKLNSEYELLVSVNDNVLINTVLAVSSNNTSIISSVSGKVLEVNDYIIIENNFKEEVLNIDISNINKEKFILLLKNSGIKGLGGASFPTYKKYISNNIETLIVNAVECEPYITADYMICKNYSSELVDTIEKIMTINNINEAFIAVKKNNNNISNFFENKMNDKIKLIEIDNFYPAGFERYLVEKIKKINYNLIPIEKNIVVNNVSTIYAIKKLLDGFGLTERIITIKNDKDINNYVVKIGTNINDILLELDIKSKNIIIGGPMMGKKFIDQVVDSSVNGILSINKLEEKVFPCIRCGKCASVCPRLLNPVLIKDNLKNTQRLKELDARKCIECGLCSYFCPSKINIREKVIEAKNSLKEC